MACQGDLLYKAYITVPVSALEPILLFLTEIPPASAVVLSNHSLSKEAAIHFFVRKIPDFRL